MPSSDRERETDKGQIRIKDEDSRYEEWPPLAATGESPRTETKTQHSNQSINQSINKKKKKIKKKKKR